MLPYWNGIPASQAADYTVEFYDKLRRALPGKRIVIAEFGWPSAGYNFQGANPGRIEQAMVLRDFVSAAEAYGIDYNIVEAIDQPWKTAEGGVGPYWGIFNAAREAKFSWTGPISDPDYVKRASLAVLLGLLLSLPILAMAALRSRRRFCLRVSANLAGAWFAAVVRFLEGPLFCPRLRLCARSRRRAAGAAGRDCARAHGRNRGHRLRPAAAPAWLFAAARAGGLCAQGVDPHSGLLRAAGNAQSHAR